MIDRCCTFGKKDLKEKDFLKLLCTTLASRLWMLWSRK